MIWLAGYSANPCSTHRSASLRRFCRAVGVWGLANCQPRKASQVVQAILESDPGPEHPGENVLLAGACLEDVDEEGLGRVMRLKVWQALEHAMRQRSLPPAAQRDAGFLLGRTGWLPEAGGYVKAEYWSKEGWKWREKDEITEPRYWHDAKWNNPLAPVVGVSWYEAEAYCNWLKVYLTLEGQL